ncbi:MAG: Asp-tRNA(Asn)/Glu-tRNA(Gln) amidotransferase subunit GatC [Clostridia bacterium]|jgi:aspartyl-tRNA(Asn)/glutamyl-tRNA(Gln) amidotransferase subunit C|nr:Asp-tRNA(Asn)/Glu-tRNA(Gln) amidotransferase subunit GatC [Clostridia bacterium]
MLITDELVTYLEALGRIKLPEESRAKAQSDLQEILQYIDTLSELDTEGIEPMSHALPLTNVMREDIVQPSVSPEEVLLNAPEQKNNYFLVPRSFE